MSDFEGALTFIRPVLPGPRTPGFGETFGAAAMLSPYVQAFQRSREIMTPPDPNYNPFDPEEIKGFEAYADAFVNVQSRAEAEALRTRIRQNEDRRRIVEDGSWTASFLADTVLDPINLLPLPLARGLGVGRAALLGGAAVGAATAVTEGVRLASDPTSTWAEAGSAVVFSSLFGAAVGGIGARLTAGQADRAARLLEADLARLERTDAPLGGRPTPEQAAPSPAGDTASRPAGEARGGEFVARATEDDAGLAPAFGGVERLASLGGTSTMGRMANAPYRAVNDFAARVTGDYGLMTKANLTGKRSEDSAFLASIMWRGAAGDGVRTIEQLWGRYIAGGEPSRIGIMAQKVFDAFRGQRPDGKMTLREFNEAVFKAHKGDRLESDIPEVLEAAKATRAIFDRARDEGANVGFLRTREGSRRRFQQNTDRANRLAQEIRTLEGKAGRTANEDALLRVQAEEYARVLDEIEQAVDQGLALDDEIAGVLDRINEQLAQRAERARTLADRIEATIAARAEKDRATLGIYERRLAERGLKPEEQAYYELLKARIGERRALDVANLPDEIDGVEIVQGPTGKTREDGSPVLAYYDRAENRIRVDVDGVAATWADKPWRDPKVPGVKALPDDLFPTPAAWVEFVIRHELAHSRAERPMGTGWIPGVGDDAPAGAAGRREFTESDKAAYENRINDIAVAEMRGPGATPRQAQAVEQLRAAAENPASARQQAYIKDMTDRLNRGVIQFPENPVDKFYLPRVWRYDLVAGNPDRLVAIFSTKMPEEEAKSVVAAMLRGFDPETGLAPPGFVSQGNGYTRFNMARKLRDFSNEELVDFIETDITALLRTYADRFGRGLEFARAFGGDPQGKAALADVLMQVARESKGKSADEIMKEIAGYRNDLEFLRDTGLGTVNDPSLMNQRTIAATARNAVSITTGGTFGLSAATEIARPMMVHGLTRTFDFAFNKMLMSLDSYKDISSELRKFVGEGWDTTLNLTPNHISQGGNAGTTSSKAVNTFNRFTEGAWYVINGLAPVTDALKRYNLVMSNQLMLEDLEKVARGTASKEVINRLASYNLDADDARRIMAQPIERTKGIWRPNLQAWDDDTLVRRYAGALAGVVRRTIVTPGVADGPDIARGFIGKDKRREFALMTLPFQFMQYTFSATNKLLISGLQGRDANFLGGMLPMVMMGLIVSWAKASNEEWNAISFEEKMIRAVDQSGVLPIISDINTMAENASQGTLGLRPALGLPGRNRDPDMFDSVGEIGGPFVGKTLDILKLFVDGDTDTADAARTIRRSLPFNNLFYIRDVFRGAERAAVDAFGP